MAETRAPIPSSEPFKFKYLKRIVFSFVLISIIIAIIIFLPIAKNQKWFIESHSYHTYLSRGYNLKPGSPIYIMDIEAGKVDKIELTENNRVKVSLKIFEDFSKRIGRDSVIIVTSPSILGGNNLEIIPTKGKDGGVPEGGLIYSEDMEEGKKLLTGFEKKSMLKNLEETVENLREISALLNDPEGDFIKGVKGFGNLAGKTLPDIGNRLNSLLAELTVIADKLGSAVSNIESFSSRLDSKEGSIGKLLSDDAKLYDELDANLKKLYSILEDLKGFSEVIRETSNEIGGIVEETGKGIEDARRLMADTEKIIKGIKKNFFIKMYLKKVEDEEREEKRR